MIGQGNFISFIIAYGGFLIVSKIPEIVPQAIFGLKPSPWEQAAGKSSPFDTLMKGSSLYSTFNKARAGYYEAETARRSVPPRVPSNTGGPQTTTSAAPSGQDTPPDHA
jgi:hypothetical protein